MKEHLSADSRVVRDDVWAALERCGGIDSSRIRIAGGKDGGVVISGVVSSYYAKQLAQHAVMSACDLSVVNELEVRQDARAESFPLG